jgi:hypothetical protein
MLASVSGMVGTKRKFLDSTVTDLCNDVAAAIDQGVSVVDSTSATASKVLSDVSAASQAMNVCASAAMDSFNEFMDQEGEALSSGLKEHFSVVACHAGAQSSGLAELLNEAGAHLEAMQACKVDPTGSTPRKTREASFEGPFKRTRSHAAIRESTRSALLDAQPVEEDAAVEGVQRVIPYETAKAGIAECAAKASAADPEEEMEIEPAQAAALPLAIDTASSPVVAEVEEETPVLSAITVGRGRSSSQASTKSAASSRLSKESASSEGGSSIVDVEIDGEGGFFAVENANPNITNTRSSRGAVGKSKSKIATLGGARSNRSSALADAI